MASRATRPAAGMPVRRSKARLRSRRKRGERGIGSLRWKWRAARIISSGGGGGGWFRGEWSWGLEVIGNW